MRSIPMRSVALRWARSNRTSIAASPATSTTATGTRQEPAHEAIVKTPMQTSTRNAGVTGIMYRSKKSAESPLVGTTEKKATGAATVTTQNTSGRYDLRASSAATPSAASVV